MLYRLSYSNLQNNIGKNINIKSIKRLSKDNYKAIIKRTPDIGSFRKNPLRISLAGGMLWLSVYMMQWKEK